MPAFSDNPDPKVIRFLPGQSGADDQYLGDLLKSLVASVKDVGARNLALEEQNAELLTGLEEATERITSFERSASANPELTRLALGTAAQIVESAQESIEASRRAVKQNSADLYEKAIQQSIQHQREALSLLESVRQETDLRNREVDRRSIDVFLQARGSILSMAKELDKPGVAGDPDRIQALLGVGAVPDQQPHQSPPSRAEAAVDAPTQPSIPSDTMVLRAHSIELVASPFQTFSAVSAFHKSLLALPGVIGVKACGFEKDTIRLMVQHSGPLPLVGALMEIEQFSLQLVSYTPGRIEVRINNG